MKVNKFIIERIRRKATKSICKYHVAALGFNDNNDCVDTATNFPRFPRLGGSYHAERILMSRARQKGIVKILICRVNINGKMLPIEPCSMCQKIAKKLDIKIVSIEE